MEKKTKKGIISIFIILIVTIIALTLILWQMHFTQEFDFGRIFAKFVPEEKNI